jgi:hypothetical protein
MSLVTARTANSAAIFSLPSIDLMTEPPWIPVAPKTTRVFFSGILDA